jgi:hypothetical protein
VPARVDEDALPSKEPAEVKFRRPPDDLVRRAARRVVRGGKASFPSQAAFREAVIALVRRDEPLATIGGRRLRRLLIGVPGVRLSVRYTERAGSALPSICPVCGGELKPIRNRTLTGDDIVLGRRCTRCNYWTHGNLRVPVRYLFSGGGIDGRPLRH